jgi:hypothetical protein
MQYLNKKNNDGSMLKIDSVKLADRMSIYCLEKTQKTEIYNVLKSFFQNDYLELFFRSLYFYEAIEISDKITLNDWETKNKPNCNLEKVNIKLFPTKKYLKDFLNLHYIKFEDKTDINVVKVRFFKIYKYIKKILKKINFYNLKKKEIIETKSPKIGVAYSEGINLDKRSDLYWLKDSKINPKDIILYFEYRGQFYRHQDKRNLFKSIEKLGLKTVNLWEVKSSQKEDFINSFKSKIKNLNSSNQESKSLKKISLGLIDRFEYWYLFFKKYNIKIQMDAKDFKQDIIIKYLALNKLGGYTINKMRSYPEQQRTNTGLPLSPCDVFFVPNKDSIARLKNFTVNKFKYIINSGYPYNLQTINNKNEIEQIKKFFSKNNKKFILLFLDNYYSDNNSNYIQAIPTNLLKRFYKVFLDELSKIDDIGIIIKNKRFMNLKKLNDVYKKATELEKKGICYIVKDPFQKMPPLYSAISNFTIAVSPMIPSALIDCVQKNKKGAFLDLVNLKMVEKEWYEWGENKVIFNDVNEMIKKIVELKNNQSNNSSFGDWSSQKDFIDEYQDNLGSIRIGKYIHSLIQSFKNELPNSQPLILANNEFAEKWGKDKIVECR